MAGHNKWSKIKRKKAANDASRGKLFTKLLKEIQIAAKMGGGDPGGNPRLKTAILASKAQSVPNDKIDNAIKKGTGDIEGVDYEEITYEGYGPGGVALILKALTDNKNRTVAEVRFAFNKYNGSMAGSNAVAYLFNEKAVFNLPIDAIKEDELMDSVLDAGVEDITSDEDQWTLIASVSDFNAVQKALEGLSLEFESTLQYIPETTVKIDEKDSKSLLNLLEALDDLDDIQEVTGNFELHEGVE